MESFRTGGSGEQGLTLPVSYDLKGWRDAMAKYRDFSREYAISEAKMQEKRMAGRGKMPQQLSPSQQLQAQFEAQDYAAAHRRFAKIQNLAQSLGVPGGSGSEDVQLVNELGLYSSASHFPPDRFNQMLGQLHSEFGQ